MSMKRVLSLALLCMAVQWGLASGLLPDYLYEEWRKSPFPQKGVTVSVNPSPLLWPSVRYWEKKDVTYNVYLSRDSVFSDESTMRSMGQRYCFFNPHRSLEPGVWYWKYEIVDNGKVRPQGVFSFVVEADAEGTVTPAFDAFVRNIPQVHPRVMNYGRNLDAIRHEAPSHPLYKRMIRAAEQAAVKPVYRGPVESDIPAEERRLNQIGGEETEIYRTLLEGYVLSGKPELLDALLERTDVLLQWPTYDLLGSKVLTSLALGYDMLYDKLDDKVKKRILAVINSQLKDGLKRWPGYTEARQVENHFWQMEITGNFTAALATLGHLKSAEEMLRYTYELFIARFPNLSTQDGGWAEGEGYYSVNQSAIVDMALLLKKIGKIDIFKSGWYRNLPDYFIYFSPVASPVSGFGDMHDRVATGSLKGRSEMLVISCEENNPKAVYRLFSSLKPADSFYGGKCPADYWKKPLAKVEPWYQIVDNVRLTAKDAVEPDTVAQDKVFVGVGAAAMHTDVLHPAENTAVFFRSSPFGAKGHMHANQNSFNISRKGERLFYPTGYYTSFADPHSLTSYRHTRAHNTILVNGCGQAFGHEGYGWIKRHLHGRLLSYVCGDASRAYRPVTDGQFKDLLEKNGIAQDSASGFGDSGLKKYERHLVFVRPDIVVVYDVLQAENPSVWTMLLHTVEKSSLADSLALQLNTERSVARADVFGSVPLRAELTDKFFSPAVDFKKKYKNGTPLQYHASFSNAAKVRNMRFLTVIRMSDKGSDLCPLVCTGKGKWTVGNVSIEAQLDAGKLVMLKVECGTSRLDVGERETRLEENGVKHSCSDLIPEGNYVY